MARVFWDTNLFIYLFQNDPVFGARVKFLRKRSLDRGDVLCTSALAVGEVLAGVYRDKGADEAAAILAGLRKAGVKILPFGESAMDHFGRIRARYRTSAADTIHLASAAAAEVDLFLTHDMDLVKLNIPGIKFIVDIKSDVL